jgi:hypothetical protein
MLRLGWVVKRQSGSHRTLSRPDWLAPLLGITILGVVLTSCGEDCAGVASCIPEWAVRVVVSSSPSGGPVKDAVVRVSGAVNATIPCNADANETECWVWGPGGTYLLEISAPGFESVQRSVRVRDSKGRCGCLIVSTQRVDVSLSGE